jgi:hypothetical protein
MKKLIIILSFLLLLPGVATARYAGKTVELPCNKGGLNHSKNFANLPPTAMRHPSRNLDFFDGIYTKRGGTALVYPSVPLNLTSFTEVDPNSRITITSTRSTFADLTNDEVAYVYKDYGTGYFGDFSFYFDARCTAVEAIGTKTHVWGVSNTVDTVDDWTAGISLMFVKVGSSYYIAFRELAVVSVLYEITLDTTYYLSVKRIGTTWSFEIHSRANRGSKYLLSSSSISVADTAYRYLYVCSSEGLANSNGTSGYSENFYINPFFAGEPEVRGIYDYRLINGNQFTIACTSDGKVYKDDVTTIKTGMSTTNWFDFAVYDDKLYIVDGTTIPQIWNGSDASTTSITSIPTEWTGNNYPQWIVVHGDALTERLWAGGCPNFPNTIYYSAGGTDNFLATGSGQIYIETGSDVGIVGAVEFGDRLLVFSKRKAYIILDTSSDINNWNYAPAQWTGGVANHRLIVKTPNDIVLMNDSGDVFSIKTVESYGDYKAASLTRPSQMDVWIREHVALSAIDDFHAIYDPKIRAIKFFVARKANPTVKINTALVYYIDRKPEEGWIVHDNQDNDSGYSASSAGVFRVNNEYLVQTGDYEGRLWELESATKKDNSLVFWAGWKTPKLNFGSNRDKKKFARLVVVATAIGYHNLNMNWWVDDVLQTPKAISMAGTGGALCFWTLCTSVLSGCELIDKPITLGVTGRRIQFEFYNDDVGKDFAVNSILIDAKVTATPY